MTIIEEITALTNEWYNLISGDHHKDRDCHWVIETQWNYGCPPKYVITHYGYILDVIQVDCVSYEEALQKLKDILNEKIKEFKEEKRLSDLGMF